jgi:CheY-like chemotaxis protein
MPPTPTVQGRVLIVEDEPLIRSLLAESLRDAGLTVIEAVNADEAWAYLAAGGGVDLVFSDVAMPGAMDGVEFATRLRALYPDLPIILASGFLGQRKLTESVIFLAKPYAFDRVTATVIKLLEQRRPNDDGPALYPDCRV